VAPVRSADGGDAWGVAGSGQPVVNGRADPAALDRRLTGPMMTCDQQHDTFAPSDRAFEVRIDRVPRAVEGHSVQIEHALRLDIAGPKLFVPAAVQRRG
jgi:hypothetical protein